LLADYPMTHSHKTESSGLTYIKVVIISVRKNKYKNVCVILKYGYNLSQQVLFQKMGLFYKYLLSYAPGKMAE
jgi:hypothetical protein